MYARKRGEPNGYGAIAKKEREGDGEKKSSTLGKSYQERTKETD